MAGQSWKRHVSTISNMCCNSTNWAKSVIPERFCTKGMNQREAWQQKKKQSFLANRRKVGKPWIIKEDWYNTKGKYIICSLIASSVLNVKRFPGETQFIESHEELYGRNTGYVLDCGKTIAQGNLARHRLGWKPIRKRLGIETNKFTETRKRKQSELRSHQIGKQPG